MSPDRDLLQDIVREARLALEFVQGMSEAEFDNDRKTQYAVVRCLEIIGEAASKLSPDARADVPAIPWREVIAQRHIAVHHYNKLSMPRIWSTEKENLPPLIDALEAYQR